MYRPIYPPGINSEARVRHNSMPLYIFINFCFLSQLCTYGLNCTHKYYARYKMNLAGTPKKNSGICSLVVLLFENSLQSWSSYLYTGICHPTPSVLDWEALGILEVPKNRSTGIGHKQLICWFYWRRL